MIIIVIMTMMVMKVNKIKDEDDELNGDAEDGDNQSLKN